MAATISGTGFWTGAGSCPGSASRRMTSVAVASSSSIRSPERQPRQARVVVLALRVPGAEPKLGTAAREQVERGHLACEQRRVPEARVEDVRAQPQPPADHRGSGQQRERAHRAQVVGRGEHVVAELVDAAHQPLELRRRAAAWKLTPNWISAMAPCWYERLAPRHLVRYRRNVPSSGGYCPERMDRAPAR